MKFIKNLPNILTLFNLFLGCMAIVYLFNDHMVIMSGEREMFIDMGQIALACYCVFTAAIIDFFDGFVARLLKAQSEFGKQLDSLADMVTFGLVPGLIMYELIARSYYANYSSFDYPVLFYSAGFALTIFAAVRLAKFNLDTQPLHRVQNAVDVFGVFFFRVGVIKAHVAHATIVACQAKVQADALGVADVQIAVGLGREACADFGRVGLARRMVGRIAGCTGPAALGIGAFLKVRFDDLAQKIAGLGRAVASRGRVGRGSSAHMNNSRRVALAGAGH